MLNDVDFHRGINSDMLSGCTLPVAKIDLPNSFTSLLIETSQLFFSILIETSQTLLQASKLRPPKLIYKHPN